MPFEVKSSFLCLFWNLEHGSLCCCFQKREESSPNLRGLFMVMRCCDSSDRMKPVGFLTLVREEVGDKKPSCNAEETYPSHL